jgi:hypothetical protein
MTAPYPADRAYPADTPYPADSPYPADRSTSADRADEVAETSVGELIGNISNDLSQLFRQEVELAKAELKQEAAKAGKAAGMLGGAGFAGYLAVVLLSFALVFGLGNVMDLGWAALIVAVIWGIIGAVLYANGRKKLKDVDPVPRRTVDTIKEDAQWLKNPTG